MAEIKYEIIEELGVLSSAASGWKYEDVIFLQSGFTVSPH